ncbi:MAG: RnfABCDGE type electron transport complex subunit D [Actinomycetota bacterium]|nr:RnfABCDGE type electron transport complex subunit D [Actinomycetota bacterium]
MNGTNKENITENNAENNVLDDSKVSDTTVGAAKDNIIVRDNNFISQSPHIWRGISSAKIMYIFLASLIFPSVAAVYFFGLRAFWVMLASTATAVLVELIIKKARKKRFKMDGSALITGLLLALTLPPRIPIWMVVIGAAFSIALAKEVFGGLGHNIFNPALAGRAFLAICFPTFMTQWYLPGNYGVDAVTSASPLSENFIFQGTNMALYRDMFFGNTAGSIGETSAMLIILAGILLIAFRIIDWKIPLVYVATVVIMSLIFGEDILFQVMAGGLLFGAVFMATDYVTSPVTGLGRIIFAVGCGLITFLIRRFGAMPEGVCFSILVMNGFTPLIDRYIRPKPFGYMKPQKAKQAK